MSYSLINGIETLVNMIPSNNSFLKYIKNIGTAAGELLSDVFSSQYGDTDTSFGYRAESTWDKFLKSGITDFSKRSPLLSGNTLFGTNLLGAPPSYTSATDPSNRSFLNSIGKDSTFIILTPGLPKYNGGLTDQLLYGTGATIRDELSVSEQIALIKTNGIDNNFFNKDKRYYTFKTDYDDYYKYLETMLNPIWIKLGLGDEFNLLTFFEHSTETIQNKSSSSFKTFFDSSFSGTEDLKKEYKSLGFFVNPANALSESISNNDFTPAGELTANSLSDTYRQLNYITGMGSTNNVAQSIGKNIKREAGIIKTTKGAISNMFENVSFSKSISGVLSGLSSLASIDLDSNLSQFATTNGMNLLYPHLWDNSSYTKNINFDFNFVSPYGDPLSIFQYVYLPFCALLCFTMPRQASENGYISPFLIRADIPGLLSVDLGMISDISWTRGGPNNLWTKDNLPRAISGTFSVNDLFPFLAMSKRISYLSANPSYTTFLDCFAGLLVEEDAGNSNIMNQYWSDLLSRINNENENGLKNKINDTILTGYTTVFGDDAKKDSITRTSLRKNLPWLSKK